MQLEKIKSTLQTWPTTFYDRFKRKLRKDELIAAMEQKLDELQQESIRTQFINYTALELHEAIDYLKNNKFEFLDNGSDKKAKK
jgi:hypothetical protein